MVRNAYYLRREKFKNVKEAVDEFQKETGAIISCRSMANYEKGIYELEKMFIPRMEKFYKLPIKEIEKDDGIDWRELHRKWGK